MLVVCQGSHGSRWYLSVPTPEPEAPCNLTTDDVEYRARKGTLLNVRVTLKPQTLRRKTVNLGTKPRTDTNSESPSVASQPKTHISIHPKDIMNDDAQTDKAQFLHHRRAKSRYDCLASLSLLPSRGFHTRPMGDMPLLNRSNARERYVA